MIERLTGLLTKTNEYWGKAIRARESYYQGMDEAALQAYTEKHPNMGPTDAQVRFGESLKGKQLIADNKWHMAQSRTVALITIATATVQLVAEQKQTNRLLKQLLEKNNG